jgi:hypothetical protein
MTKIPSPDGFSFATFFDGFKPGDDFGHYMSELKRRGSQALTELVMSSANEGRPFTGLVHTILLPWAADVVSGLHLPLALLWIQPATVLDIYYYYFNGYGDVIRNSNNDPSCSVELSGLPLFASHDQPSFLLASNTCTFMIPTFQEQLEALEKESKPRTLVNTFDVLEPKALRVIEKFNLIGIGPLIPSAFIDGKDPSDTCLGGDLFQSSKDHYILLSLKVMFFHASLNLKTWLKISFPVPSNNSKLIMEVNMLPWPLNISLILMASCIDLHVHIPQNRMTFPNANTDASLKLPCPFLHNPT